MLGTERNVIGGFTATVLTPMIDGWAKLLPYICFAIILILADLRYGLKAARKRGEEIRRSRAWRRSLNKLVDYLCWLSIFGITFGKDFGVPIISYIVLAIIYIIEMQSILDNYLEYKGLNKKISLWKLFRSIFKKAEADIEEAIEDSEKPKEEVIEEEEVNE